jgi:hypothetical protein
MSVASFFTFDWRCGAGFFAFLILRDGLSKQMKEFWPDIRRKVFHKSSP